LGDSCKERIILDEVVMIVRDENGGVVLRRVSLPASGGGDSAVWREAIGSGEPASGTVTFSGDDPYHVYAVPVDRRVGQA
jgi:hypothetical protein